MCYFINENWIECKFKIDKRVKGFWKIQNLLFFLCLKFNNVPLISGHHYGNLRNAKKHVIYFIVLSFYLSIYICISYLLDKTHVTTFIDVHNFLRKKWRCGKGEGIHGKGLLKRYSKLNACKQLKPSISGWMFMSKTVLVMERNEKMRERMGTEGRQATRPAYKTAKSLFQSHLLWV